MWTYHGREFPAPTWDLGTSPAGSLYSSANDLSKLLKFLFANGTGPQRTHPQAGNAGIHVANSICQTEAEDGLRPELLRF